MIKAERLAKLVEINATTKRLREIEAKDVPTLGMVDIYLKIGKEALGYGFYVVLNDFPCGGNILGDFLEYPDLKLEGEPGKSISINGNKFTS